MLCHSELFGGRPRRKRSTITHAFFSHIRGTWSFHNEMHLATSKGNMLLYNEMHVMKHVWGTDIQYRVHALFIAIHV